MVLDHCCGWRDIQSQHFKFLKCSKLTLCIVADEASSFICCGLCAHGDCIKPIIGGGTQADTVQDGALELYPEAGSAANIGIMLFRPTAADFAKVATSTHIHCILAGYALHTACTLC